MEGVAIGHGEAIADHGFDLEVTSFERPRLRLHEGVVVAVLANEVEVADGAARGDVFTEEGRAGFAGEQRERHGLPAGEAQDALVPGRGYVAFEDGGCEGDGPEGGQRPSVGRL
ncbi:MAG: hypothetical protein IPG47_11505 [Thermoflexaceae bacterium]|nr:hypothetical protein [Thermoflexaceae bacterium]